MSKIEWTEKTWNPVVGCDKVSAGCKNCYAINMANRLQGMPATKEKYVGTVKKTASGLNWTGKVNIHKPSLLLPLQTKKPTMWFVNSMSDLFHDDVPFSFIDEVYKVMAQTKHHTYQVLTKRSNRMLAYYRARTYTEKDLPNVWVGVSVEDQKAADERIPLLLQVPAAVRWLSMEPLLGPVEISYIKAPEDDEVGASRIWPLEGRRTDMGRPCAPTGKINWVVVGGESGHDARPMHPDWVRSIYEQCQNREVYPVPFFFKQWGEYWPHCQLDLEQKRAAEQGTEHLLIAKEIKLNLEGKSVQFPSPHNPDKMNNYYKIGKHHSGRLLDGVLYNEYPKTHTHA